MLILALDTSGARGSAAVIRDDRVLAERAGDPARTQAERLPSDLMAVLDQAGYVLSDVDLFTVAVGPGSFTGLRIGIATVQGLAFARDRRVVPVTTFEAFAEGVAGDDRVAVWIDAHRGEVFATIRDGRGAELVPPSSRPPAETLDAWESAGLLGGDVRFAGDGAVRYRDVLAARLGSAEPIAAEAPLLAGRIGLIAARHADRAVVPHAVVPMYVRRPDVELTRDRRRAE